MHVFHGKHSYPQDPVRYLHLEDYLSDRDDIVVISDSFGKPFYWKEYGLTDADVAKFKSKKIVRLDFAEPTNFLLGDYSRYQDELFYRIFTICPYTADWLNTKYAEKKRVPIFFPVNERYIPKKQKKTIDILYTGHIVSSELRKELNELKHFNYALVSNSVDPLVTHKSASYKEKMKLYAKSKITLIHNIVYRTYPHRIMNIWLTGDYWNNNAFSQIPSPLRPWELFSKNYHLPQLKSRVFEAAVSGSLILCRRDEFNIIERYFIPDKEFVYYEQGKLRQTVKHILANYGKYEDIADRAYNRAVKEYTVKAFVNKYLKPIRA